MKSVSKAALAAAVVLSVPGIVAVTPAVAQKKKADSSPQFSDAFRKVAGPVQELDKAKKWAEVTARIDAVDAVAQSDDEKYYASTWRLNAAANTNDRPQMIRALNALVANPKTPQSDIGKYSFFLGDYAAQDKKFAEAAAHFVKSRDLGYQHPATNIDLKIAQVLLDGNQVPQGIAAIETAIKAEEAAGRKAPESWYKIAVSRLYTSGNKAGAADWLSRQLRAYPSPALWRSSLMVYLEQQREAGKEANADLRLDALRLIRATKGLAGETDYFEYADAAQRRGLPWEVVSVIDEGRAAGTIAKPSARFDPIYTQAVNRQKAEVSLAAEEKRAAGAANGAVAMSTADAYLASRNLPKAVELYRLALQKGGVDTNLVNTRLGIALALSGQKAEAKTAFAAVTGAPRNEMARFWTAWLDSAA